MKRLTQLGNLIVDNPVQVRRIDSLKILVARQMALLKLNIDTRDTRGLDYMVANHMFLSGKGNMDSIREMNRRVVDYRK